MSDPGPIPDLIERPCPFITFYSFKGGVGRSMAVINVAGIMASRGFRVLVVDMDLEAPGLSFLANPASAEAEKPRLSQPGFVDFMLDAVERGADGDLFQLSAAEAVRSYSAPYELPEDFRRSPDGSLHIMPAGRIDDGYARRLTRLDLPALYQEGFGLALVKAFKQVVQDSKLFDYVFVDSRTGFSDESGICTRDLADCLMVVSGLNKQNVEGTTRFLWALRQATEERKPLEVILSPIPNGEDALVDKREEQARAAFQEAWGAPIRTELHIPYHPQLALTEEPHIFRRRRGYLFEAYNKIERNVLKLLAETWDGILNATADALKRKDYSTAGACLRRASKLSDTDKWADIQLFYPDLTWIADTNAEPIFDYIIQYADTPVKEWLGQWIGNEAIDHEKNDPKIAIALYERALVADPRNITNIDNYANFLCGERKDLDAAEAIYKRALRINPNDVSIIDSYAEFLCDERKNLDTAETMYERALEVNPNDASILGSYANFLCNERKNLDAAETMYERALEVNPNDASILGSYANFLCNERKNLNAAEAMYKRALEAAPADARILRAYANFLCNKRKNLDAAEAMYKRALEADPTDANVLGNYANFLSDKRKHLDVAEAMYERALKADPTDANVLLNYADFLSDERKNLDAAQAMYERALKADPTDANVLGNYANFLSDERKNLDAAQAMYERALEADPTDANVLGNYANFLSDERKNLDAAQAMYERALEADPTDANVLGNYANFLSDERKNLDAAQAMYERALRADPTDANILANYGRLYLTISRVNDGIKLIDLALAIRAGTRSPDALDGECWMYIFCCGEFDRQGTALQQLRTLVEVHSVCTEDWDFSGVIVQAQDMGHPEAAWLPVLADVLAGRRPPSTLEDWPAWRATTHQ